MVFLLKLWYTKDHIKLSVFTPPQAHNGWLEALRAWLVIAKNVYSGGGLVKRTKGMMKSGDNMEKDNVLMEMNLNEMSSVFICLQH